MNPTENSSENISTQESGSMHRKATITIKNNSGFALFINDRNSGCSQGRTDHLIPEISPGSSISIIGNSYGMGTGTAGYVTYYICDDSFDFSHGQGKSWIYITWSNPYYGSDSWGADWFDEQGNGEHKNSPRFKVELSNSPDANAEELVVEYTVENI